MGGFFFLAAAVCFFFCGGWEFVLYKSLMNEGGSRRGRFFFIEGFEGWVGLCCCYGRGGGIGSLIK